MSLTDDWKAGRLEDGYYYVRIQNNSIMVMWLTHKSDINGWEVLGKCPDYEELQKLKKNRDNWAYECGVTTEKYNREYRLLKECKKEIDKNYQQLARINSCPRSTTAFWQIESVKDGLKRLLARINSVTGEEE